MPRGRAGAGPAQALAGSGHRGQRATLPAPPAREVASASLSTFRLPPWEFQGDEERGRMGEGRVMVSKMEGGGGEGGGGKMG